MAANFIKIILIIIGVGLLIWFLLPYFSNRILNIGNATGIIVSLVLFLYGLFFHTVNYYISWFWRYPLGRIIEIILAVCIFAIFILAVITSVAIFSAVNNSEIPKYNKEAYSLNGKADNGSPADISATENSEESATSTGGTDIEGEKETEKSNHMIILGCKIRDDRPSLMLLERLEAGFEYLVSHTESKVIVSGGQGDDEITAEANVMSEWLVANGISKERIIKEDKSTDTEENLVFSKPMLDEINGDEPVLIVTNEFHEYRALKKAAKLGIKAEPLPAKTAWWLFPTYYVREMYGILEDWFLIAD